MQIALPGAHGIRVDLAHVPPPVHLLYVLDVQIPRAVVVVRQADARVLSYYVVVDAEDRLGVHSYPRNLCTKGFI